MKMRRLLVLVSTGFASVLLLFFALETEGAGFDWLSKMLFGPGLFVAHLLVPKNPQAHNSALGFEIAFGFDFAFAWIALLIVAFLLERLLTRRKKKA